jgi:hypothetical protein
MSDPDVSTRLARTFIQAVPPTSAEAFREEIAADLAKWTRVVRDARIEQQ